MRSLLLFRLAGVALLAAGPAPCELKAVHPTVRSIVDSVSEERIAAHMRKLESFGTRETHSEGAVAARQWILKELKSYSPRLEVRMDTHSVKRGGRILRDMDVVNVVAVLPGKSMPDRQIVIGAHYDDLILVPRKGAVPGEGETMDPEASAAAPKAPGVSDNASGVAAMLELARVLSRQEFDKTLVFIAFGAEEQGLIGASLYAAAAHDQGDRIEAVFNNDIIGNDRASNGVTRSNEVNLFSGDPMDSPSRALARYICEVGARYVPAMRVNLIFRADRFGRGGDHTPFHDVGYAAVRFTTAAEALELQHTTGDNMAAASPAYTARVARVNAAAMASLALAPKPPVVVRQAPVQSGRTAPPNLARGQSRYDAVLRWTNPEPESDLLGYAVVVRSTLAPLWEREVFVGNVQEYTMRDVSIDDVVLGIKAINRRGFESMVSAYVMAPYRRTAPQAAAPGQD
jgi:hypothetical protein